MDRPAAVAAQRYLKYGRASVFVFCVKSSQRWKMMKRPMNSVVLLGGSGYVGKEFYKQLKRNNFRVTCVGRCSRDDLKTRIEWARPDAVINCAGYTGKPNVDACETDKTNCLFANATFPGIVAETCAELGIRAMCHVSSGCIYNGYEKIFTEKDEPNFSFRAGPCSFYSGTKALAEEILRDFDDVYVWRLRVPFSEVDGPRNYLTKVMNYDTLLDVRNSLSHLGQFVGACIECLEYGSPGTYNITNPGSVSTREIVELIREAGITHDKKEWKFFDDESDFMEKAAKTPRSSCVLDSSKVIAVGAKLPHVKDAIRDSLKQWSVKRNVPSPCTLGKTY